MTLLQSPCLFLLHLQSVFTANIASFLLKDLIPELYLEVFEFYLLQFLVSLFFNSSPTTDEEM